MPGGVVAVAVEGVVLQRHVADVQHPARAQEAGQFGDDAALGAVLGDARQHGEEEGGVVGGVLVGEGEPGNVAEVEGRGGAGGGGGGTVLAEAAFDEGAGGVHAAHVPVTARGQFGGQAAVAAAVVEDRGVGRGQVGAQQVPVERVREGLLRPGRFPEAARYGHEQER